MLTHSRPSPSMPSHICALPGRALPGLAAQLRLLPQVEAVLISCAQYPLAMVCLVRCGEQGCRIQAGFVLLCNSMGPDCARDGGAGLCVVKKGSMSCSEKLIWMSSSFPGLGKAAVCWTEGHQVYWISQPYPASITLTCSWARPLKIICLMSPAPKDPAVSP